MTEHSAIRDYGAIRNALEGFRRRGFRLAMDDVGSGYSGLQAIAEISPDFIKIDMSLVRDVHRHPIKHELISTIRRFSDSTGISMIAEGVEAPDELDSLLASGVRCAQGFLFARPDAPPGTPDWSLLLGGRPR
jgi:EAL domain-containing protein (putative c-di-GMP-specific phosphodiesterase class I)